MTYASELTEKETTTALHEVSVEEAKKVAVTFPECFRCRRKTLVWQVFLSQFKLPWSSKGWPHCKEMSCERANTRKWEEKVDAKVKMWKREEERAKGPFRFGSQPISEWKWLAHSRWKCKGVHRAEENLWRSRRLVDWGRSSQQGQTEHTPITATRIKDATISDPLLSRVLHFVLPHGWTAEENTPKKLRFYRTKGEKFTVEAGCSLRGTREVIPSRYWQGSAVRTTLKPPRNGANKIFDYMPGGQTWTTRAFERLETWWKPKHEFLKLLPQQIKLEYFSM